MALINLNDYELKFTYENISVNPSLVNIFPLTIIAKAKERGYVYYSELDTSLRYKIAKTLFKNNGIIRINDQGDDALDHSKLPFTNRDDLRPLDEIAQEDLIYYFTKYNVEVKNIIITVYKNEYQISIPVASLFMDTKSDNISMLETDLEEFIISNYRKFISTPFGSVMFMPWYGTKIKEYLHNLSIYQVEEMLQAEMDGLTYLLKNYFILNNITDLDFFVEVETEENIEYGIVKYKIIITINNVSYTITIQ